METPSWQDPDLSTMKRAALWLVQEVGVGESFTKGQLREAFPDTAQIDRRMRDLRSFGWRIDTNRDDYTLEQHEQRFAEQGIPVWEPGRSARPGVTITEVERRALLARDDYRCRSCGIAGGEKYDGTDRRAQLDVARRPVRQASGESFVQNVTECTRCRVGGRELTTDLGDILERAGQLPALERRMLASWIAGDERPTSEVDRLWAVYRTLPADSRDLVRDALR